MAFAHRSPLARSPTTRPFLACFARGRFVPTTHRAPGASPARGGGRRAAGVLRRALARRWSGSRRLGWTTFGVRGAALVFISRGAAGNDRARDDPAGHSGRQALLHWQV